MARTATTFDAFNALAEPKRRRLLEVLGGDKMTVNQLVSRLGWAQPSVSKHLRVLKAVQLVIEAKQGRQRIYQLNASTLKETQQWFMQFEKVWGHSLDRLDDYLTEIQNKEAKDD
jgi:DNA-binding transcriptional ArsR family regulator